MARESPTTRREVAAVAAAWWASEADARASGADPRFPVARRGSVWISWQPVELRAHREGDSSRIWRSLQPASCFPIAQEAGLDAASSDPPRHPTGREKDRPLAEGSVARAAAACAQGAPHPGFYRRIRLLPFARCGANL